MTEPIQTLAAIVENHSEQLRVLRELNEARTVQVEKLAEQLAWLTDLVRLQAGLGDPDD